jgi:hypothetical protein
MACELCRLGSCIEVGLGWAQLRRSEREEGAHLAPILFSYRLSLDKYIWVLNIIYFFDITRKATTVHSTFICHVENSFVVAWKRRCPILLCRASILARIKIPRQNSVIQLSVAEQGLKNRPIIEFYRYRHIAILIIDWDFDEFRFKI